MKSVVAEMPVKLLLVLEIEPWTYSKRRAPEGPGGAPVDASEWDAHFRQCMADAGFADVEPIRVGSHHVEARTLAGTPLLERIVRQKLERSGIAGFPDADGQIAEPRERILALSGGYALCSAGVALIEPR